MNKPEETVGLKHIIFCISLLAVLLTGMIALFLALVASNDSKYLEAGIFLIASAISFGSAMVTTLILARS